MANYGPLALIKDPAAKSLLRQIVDQISALSGRVDGGPSWKADINAGGFRVTSAGEAIEGSDVATLQQVESFLLADVLRKRLEAGGDAELNVSGLAGRLGEPQNMGINVIPNSSPLPNVTTAQPYAVVSWQGKLYYFSPLTNPGAWVPLSAAASIVADTHANRIANYLPANQPLGLLFWETDRTVLYYITSAAGVQSWTYMLGQMRGTLPPGTDQRPIDLAAGDANFRYEGTNFEEHYRWTGSAWQLIPNEETKVNEIRNASFEWYEGWDPTATPAVYDPTYWSTISGLGAAARSTTQVKVGTYSCALTNTAANLYARTQILGAISATTNSNWRGRQVVYGCWVYASTAGRVTISIGDGVATTTSTAHSGSSTWEYLVVTHTIAASASTLDVTIGISSGGAITAYFDGASLTVGSVPSRNAPTNAQAALTYPYRVQVYTTAVQTITTGTDTAMLWTAEAIDKGELHSLTVNTDRLTVPVGAGASPSIWTVYASIRWDPNAVGQRILRINKNGTRVFENSVDPVATAATATIQTLCFPVYDLADGDYFTVEVRQSSGGNLDVQASTAGTIFGLCRTW